MIKQAGSVYRRFYFRLMAKKSSVATIKDIARECGASVTTVSRVLSNSGYPVSTQMRDRIVKTAQKLNYTPNLFARGLKTNESTELAILVPNIVNPFYTSLVSGIESVAAKEGYNILLYNTNGNNLSEGKIINSIHGKRISGMIISTGNDNAEFIRELQSNRKPSVKIVMVDYTAPGCNHSSVYYDYRKGSALGVEYLIKNGHRNIIYAGLKPDRRTRADRIEGFKDVIGRAGLHFGEEMLCIYDGSANEKENLEFYAGIELAKRICTKNDRPTAVVAMNDMVAFGLMNHFNREGVKIPQDISILGFDDNLFCEVSYPPLTTVRVPSRQMGELAAKILVDELRSDGASPYVNLTVEPSLVERSTVAQI